MRNFKLHMDGLVTCDQIKQAESIMKNVKDGTCLITAMNGTELYIKKNNKVKVSTQKEFEDYFSNKSINFSNKLEKKEQKLNFYQKNTMLIYLIMGISVLITIILCLVKIIL